MKNLKILRNIKIAFWIIILIIIGLLGYQNKVFFMAKHSLGLKLPFLEIVNTPELSNALLFLIFFLAGFLIAYFLNLAGRFKSKKTVKNLKAEAASQQDDISTLRKEVETLRIRPSGYYTEPEKTEPEKTKPEKTKPEKAEPEKAEPEEQNAKSMDKTILL